MPTVARLTNTDLIVESEFDEITQSAIAVTDLAFYADEFDEITAVPVAMRRQANGVLIINGEYNEVDGFGFVPFSLEGDLSSLSGSEDLATGSGSLDLSV